MEAQFKTILGDFYSLPSMIDFTPQAKRQRLAIIPESPPMPPLVSNAPATSPLISNPPTQVDDDGLEMSAVNAVVPLCSELKR